MKKQPLYQKAAEMIRGRYVSGRPIGHRLPSQKELEQELKVSSMTVRNALRLLEVEGALQQRQGSGTFVMEAKVNPRHVAVLLETELSDKRLSSYYITILQEVRLALLKADISTRPYLGYLRLGIEIGELTCRELIEDLRLDRISGVICLLAQRHPSWVYEVRKRFLPLAGSVLSGDYVVDVDVIKQFRKVLDYLMSRGRRRLCYVNWTASSYHTQLMAAQAPEYGFDAQRFMMSLNAPDLHATREWQGFRRFLEDPRTRPDSLVVLDDTLFEPVQALLLELGLPKEELDVVLICSDVVVPEICIPVTRSLYHVATKARLFAETMQKLLKGEEVASFTEVPVTLIPAGVEIPAAMPVGGRGGA